MLANLLPLLSYIVVSTFTPGPSNLASASMGILHGYRHSLKLQVGLAAGVLIGMLLSGWVSNSILGSFPVLEPVLRVAGAAYILYLAFTLFRAGYNIAEENVEPLGLHHGLVLQLSNPKLWVYAFTLFSTFLASTTKSASLVLLAATLLAALSFVATSVWAFFGAGIKNRLQNPRLKVVVNIVLSLALVYAAIALVIIG